MATPTYIPLATYTTTSGVSELNITNINQSYSDLVFVVTAPSRTTWTDLLIRLNGDTVSSFSGHQISGKGTTTENGTWTGSVAYFGYCSGSGGWQTVTQIQGYSSTTTHKPMLSRCDQASSRTQAIAALWESLSAVTSIRLFNYPVANFPVGTRVDVFGIQS